MYIYIYIYVHICVYIYIYIYVCVCVCVYLSLSLYIYIYIYMYIPTGGAQPPKRPRERSRGLESHVQIRWIMCETRVDPTFFSGNVCMQEFKAPAQSGDVARVNSPLPGRVGSLMMIITILVLI